jgi:hypothetical protein
LGVKKGGMRNTGYDRRYVQRVASKGGETFLSSISCLPKAYHLINYRNDSLKNDVSLQIKNKRIGLCTKG